MEQQDATYKHSALQRLDNAIEQLEATIKRISDNTHDSSLLKGVSILVQTHKDVLNVREEAVNTLTRLNILGATLETLAHPNAGVDATLENVFKWFLLLSECDRAFISLFDAVEKEYILKIEQSWMGVDLRPMELGISDKVIQEVITTKTVFTSNNLDMASESYQKSGSWRIPLRTVIGIPMVWNDELIAIYYGDKKITSGLLHRDMIPIFKLYAAEAAIAIHNAQLFATLSQSTPKATVENTPTDVT